MPQMIHLACLLSFVVMLLTPGAIGAAAAPDSGYNAGFTLMRAAAGSETVRLAVWYPTRAREAGLRLGPYRLPVTRNAPLANVGRPRPFGLIILSHGARGGALSHRDTARALARAGFVVAAIHHPGDNWEDGSRTGATAMWARRPAHVSAAIDGVLADSRLGRAVDPGRIGALGFSAGGYTVLAAAGARPDLAALVRHCRARRAKDPQFCAYRKAAPDRTSITVRSDHRIRAVVAIAPVGAVFGPGSISGVTAAVLLIRGGRDRILRHPWHAEQVHRMLRAAGRSHDYVVFPSAGHFTFLAPFPPEVAGQVGAPAQDPPGTDRKAVHRKLNRRAVAFFRKALPTK